MTDPANTPAETLVAAQAHAIAARQSLSITVEQVKQRLDPQLLADTAKQAGLDTARRNPVALASVAGVVTVFLARRPIARLFRRTS